LTRRATRSVGAAGPRAKPARRVKGNGNLTQVLDATATNNISIAAHYEYDPYGNLIHSSGPYADLNPIRFSTKWFDEETHLGYWGYRYYSPRLGRWLSRDPMEEKGGWNLYAAMANSPVYWFDSDGAEPTTQPAVPAEKAISIGGEVLWDGVGMVGLPALFGANWVWAKLTTWTTDGTTVINQPQWLHDHGTRSMWSSSLVASTGPTFYRKASSSSKSGTTECYCASIGYKWSQGLGEVKVPYLGWKLTLCYWMQTIIEVWVCADGSKDWDHVSTTNAAKEDGKGWYTRTETLK